MPMKKVPNTPIIDQITLVLVLLGSSDIMRISITEKMYIPVKPTQAQSIDSGIDPFVVFKTMMLGRDSEYVAAIPRLFNILAMNEVSWGMRGENIDSAKSDTKKVATKATMRNRGEKASLRARIWKKMRKRPNV